MCLFLSRYMELGSTSGRGQHLQGSLCPFRVIIPILFDGTGFFYLMIKHGLPAALWLLCFCGERRAHVSLEMDSITLHQVCGGLSVAYTG